MLKYLLLSHRQPVTITKKSKKKYWMWVIVGLFFVKSIYYAWCYLCHNSLDVIVTNFNCQKFDVVRKKESFNVKHVGR